LPFAKANGKACGECKAFAKVVVTTIKMMPHFAFATGECGVFANSLKRIGKWRMRHRLMRVRHNLIKFLIGRLNY